MKFLTKISAPLTANDALGYVRLLKFPESCMDQSLVVSLKMDRSYRWIPAEYIS